MVSRNDNSSPYFPHREEPPPLKPATQLVHFEAAPDDSFQPSSTPIYQTATFCQSSATEGGRYDYTRSGNPTRTVLEEQLARLEGGSRAFAFTSGMAAITAVASLAEPGQEILAGNDLYGGTYRLLTRVVARQGIAVRFVDTTDGDAVEQELSRRPRLVLIETPTNPLLQVTDIAALTGQPEYAQAVDKIWEDVVSRKMYLSGGVGSIRQQEKFGAAYELPNHSSWHETCASYGMVVWNHRLFLLHRDGKYIDTMERVLYNGFNSGVSLRGDRFFYQCVLKSFGNYGRFYTINVELEQSLAMRFGVQGVPTFMVFCKGNMVSSQVGEVYPRVLERLVTEAGEFGGMCAARATKVIYEMTGYG